MCTAFNERSIKEAIQLVETALRKHKPPSRLTRRSGAGADPAAAFKVLKPRGRAVHGSVHTLQKSALHRAGSEERLARSTTGKLTSEEQRFQAERERVVRLIEDFLDEWEDFVSGLTGA
jgi:hypothetical protein